MTQTTPPGFGDLLGLFGGVNPLAAITKSISQFQRGVSDLLSAVENFNNTMVQLNGVATRINGLLDTVEGPVKAFVPQLTRTINAADALVEQLSGPIDKVAPGLAKLAEVLSSPSLTSLPNDLGEFMGVLSDLARRLQPLGQMAEAAGGMFGLRPLAAMFGGAPTPAAQPAPTAAATKTAPVKKPAAKKSAAKKSTPKPGSR
jgi:ABC-type transporter Mla subunit MlaD